MKVHVLTPEDISRLVSWKLIGGSEPEKIIEADQALIDKINKLSNDTIPGRWTDYPKNTHARFTLTNIQRIIGILKIAGYESPDTNP